MYCIRLLAWWSIVGNFAFLFNFTPVGRTLDSVTVLTKDFSIDEIVGPDALAAVRPTWVYLLDFFCPGIYFFFTDESLSLLYLLLKLHSL